MRLTTTCSRRPPRLDSFTVPVGVTVPCSGSKTIDPTFACTCTPPVEASRTSRSSASGAAQTGGGAAAAPRSDVPTYAKDVAPIVQQHCQTCHRPGEPGPFPLLTYQDARRRAGKIRVAVADRIMPPWFADPHYGTFSNAMGLSETERDTILRWADGGAPEGDPKDAPKPIAYTDGWMLGKPDLILTTGDEFKLGASGPDAFRCFVMSTNLPEDKYIVGFEVKPGNPRVVHHTLNFWDLTGKARKMELEAKDKASATDRDRGPSTGSDDASLSCRVRRIDDHRKMRHLFDERNPGKIECVTKRVIECLDSSLA